jgi:hypothetical protein
MSRRILAAALIASLLAMLAALTLRHSTSTARADAVIIPNDFATKITNPWLPYKAGSVWVYRGVKDGQTQRDVVKATHRKKVILGVTCTVVSDIATHHGTVLERTTDWYAQDKQGNVWYFGERTAAYSNGTVDRSGSWQAGVDGAQPGIFMNAHPAIGNTHRQEYLKGVAEDQYWLVDLSQTAKVPYGTFHHAALTLEWSRLEPNVIDRKLYVRGVGDVSEIAASGPHETAKLVSFHHA